MRPAFPSPSKVAWGELTRCTSGCPAGACHWLLRPPGHLQTGDRQGWAQAPLKSGQVGTPSHLTCHGSLTAPHKILTRGGRQGGFVEQGCLFLGEGRGATLGPALSCPHFCHLCCLDIEVLKEHPGIPPSTPKLRPTPGQVCTAPSVSPTLHPGALTPQHSCLPAALLALPEGGHRAPLPASAELTCSAWHPLPVDTRAHPSPAWAQSGGDQGQ